MTTIRTHSELIKITTFEGRFEYLKLNGAIGQETFGYDRYLNQMFYHRDKRWKSVRDEVILRDNACDLALPGYDIFGKIVIHHMNPLTLDDIENETEFLLNPEYLICVSPRTHSAIHYGNPNMLLRFPKERTPNDTCPWKH